MNDIGIVGCLTIAALAFGFGLIAIPFYYEWPSILYLPGGYVLAIAIFGFGGPLLSDLSTAAKCVQCNGSCRDDCTCSFVNYDYGLPGKRDPNCKHCELRLPCLHCKGSGKNDNWFWLAISCDLYSNKRPIHVPKKKDCKCKHCSSR